MNNQQPNNPLHGITLEMILTQLVEHYGWEEMGRIINIRSFNNDPSIKSSLKFLRKTPWARKKVEDLYLRYTKRFGDKHKK
ncbi:DNA-binding protein [Candidatus Brocadiaceae bacterium]|nr:DNA-binding protein [Candidatus Brocadiaceae bacterium]